MSIELASYALVYVSECRTRWSMDIRSNPHKKWEVYDHQLDNITKWALALITTTKNKTTEYHYNRTKKNLKRALAVCHVDYLNIN